VLHVVLVDGMYLRFEEITGYGDRKYQGMLPGILSASAKAQFARPYHYATSYLCKELQFILPDPKEG
jgi:hypothetical protein